MKPELDNQSVHRYMRVYNYYKQLILSQQLAPGSGLPSIRRCAAELQMKPDNGGDGIHGACGRGAILFPGRRADFM